jgi:hypothetical protein
MYKYAAEFSGLVKDLSPDLTDIHQVYSVFKVSFHVKVGDCVGLLQNESGSYGGFGGIGGFGGYVVG